MENVWKIVRFILATVAIVAILTMFPWLGIWIGNHNIVVTEKLVTVVTEKPVVQETEQLMTQPAMPTSILEVVQPTALPTQLVAPKKSCRVIHESVVVETMDHVSTSGNYIHLEYWWDGQPERETIFTASQAAGGRFNFNRSLKGWVWEYAGCTYDEVYAQVQVHITRRLEGKANNAGFVLWDETGLFKPVPLSQP